ncbi:arrestin [Echria macrotheca]|uniref:Arrestin n=1 Tax=Echria macrotheca TaxID=438768 RepID=A0AAJ0BCM1_9PEZI|nr:arrestin [Echria macrotheca]
MSIALLRNMTEASSAMASTLSDRGTEFPSSAGMMPFPKSNIDINLSNHYSSKIYTSSSPVTGTVSITTKRDVRFDSIQILLMGHTKTKVEGVSSPHEVTHTFLKMIMPVPESTYPVPRVLENGRTYTVPFNFVIPNQLTINACNHKMESDRLQDQHVLLPPSMCRWEKDDMAPEMARVEYVIKARVLRQDDLGGKSVRIMEATQPIHVLPASAEEPPLNITDQDRLYKMRKTKSIRRNLLSSKLGTLTAEASQPTPAVIRADSLRLASKPTTQINLRFEPASPDVLPPRITGVTGKVTAHTFYSSGTIDRFPNLGSWNQQFVTERRGAYATSVSLPPISTPEVNWAQKISGLVRRDSGYSSDTNTASDSASTDGRRKSSSKERRRTSASSGSTSPIYHTALLQVPVSLPVDKKTFIPTFHSCIASRVYTLQLAVQVAVGSSSSTTTVALTVPLQVAIESDVPQQTQNALPSFEEAEAEAHLRPRVLAVPAVEFRETSVLPGYA